MAATELEMITYFMTFILGVIFSIISIFMASEKEKSPLAVACTVISFIVWFGLGLFHVALLYDSVFLPLSYVFYGLGVVFMVWAIALTASLISDAVTPKDETLVLK